MSEPRTCTVCGTEGLTEACPVCTEAWENRKPAEEMTAEERAAELDAIPDILEIDWPKVHQRIGELVGRGVFTHELGTGGMAYLRNEILTGDRPGLDGIMAKFPADKKVIPIVIDEED